METSARRAIRNHNNIATCLQITINHRVIKPRSQGIRPPGFNKILVTRYSAQAPLARTGAEEPQAISRSSPLRCPHARWGLVSAPGQLHATDAASDGLHCHCVHYPYASAPGCRHIYWFSLSFFLKCNVSHLIYSYLIRSHMLVAVGNEGLGQHSVASIDLT